LQELTSPFEDLYIWAGPEEHLKAILLSDVNLTPSLLAMLERIEQHSPLLMLAVTASGGQDGKLNKLRGAGYVVKCDHPSVTEGAWPAEALAITEAGRTALAKHRALPRSSKTRTFGEAEVAEKGRHRSGDKRVIFRRDRDRLHRFPRGRSDRVCAACR